VGLRRESFCIAKTIIFGAICDQQGKNRGRPLVGHSMKHSILGICIAALLASSGTALAGGFAIREQSTIGQGMSFAGVAAGSGGLSSLFWNPAISSEYNEFGFISESNSALILPYAKSSLGSGNIGELALVPAGYFSYALTDQITVASSMNAPVGLTTDGNNGWAGSPFGDKSSVKTYNFNPTISYKVNDMLSFGVGAQIEFMQVELTNRTPGGVQFLGAKGDSLGLGFTAGVLFEPTDTTDIGVGFRSSVAQTLKGDGFVGAFSNDISAKFSSPELLTVGVRQEVTDQLSLSAGVEWANWSRFKKLQIEGLPVPAENFEWKDSWYFSLGAEYAYNDALTLRSGVAYEKSPVPDATRSVRVPDNDRFWLSLGASYKFAENMTANLAYSHVFMEDGDIGAPLNTSFKQHLDIVSVGLTRDW
jgi:long-chain fatty acid transport protein